MISNIRNGIERNKSFRPILLLISSTSGNTALVAAVYRISDEEKRLMSGGCGGMMPVFCSSRMVPAPATYPPTVCVFAVKVSVLSFLMDPPWWVFSEFTGCNFIDMLFFHIEEVFEYLAF